MSSLRCRHCRDIKRHVFEPWVRVCRCEERDFSHAHLRCHVLHRQQSSLRSCEVCGAPYPDFAKAATTLLYLCGVAVGFWIGRKLAYRTRARAALDKFRAERRFRCCASCVHEAT